MISAFGDPLSNATLELNSLQSHSQGVRNAILIIGKLAFFPVSVTIQSMMDRYWAHAGGKRRPTGAPTRFVAGLWALAVAVVALTCGQGIARANDVYIAQNATGSANGSSCTNALATSYFNTSGNWTSSPPSGTKIGPGTTVHLCGTITSQVAAQGSGSSGSPITVLFEPGAKISMGVCPNGGCMTFNGLNYIVLDGGSTVNCGYVSGSDVPCNNGTIENTSNGTGLSTQSPSQAVYATPCHHCEFKNLLIRNLYVHIPPNDNVVDNTSVRCFTVTGSDILVHNNTMHDMSWCLIDSYSEGDANVSFYNNEIYNIDHGYVLSAATYLGSSGPFYFYNNHVHGFSNWDSSTNAYHHDAVHCFSSNARGNSLVGFYIYNNLFGGPEGTGINSLIYIEGSSGPPCATTTSPVYLFNNVLASDHWSNAGNVYLGSGEPTVYNNTLISTDTNSGGTCFDNTGAAGGIGPATDKNNVVAGCRILDSYAPGSWVSGSPDYNAYGYVTGYTSSDFWCSGVGQTSFAGWKTCIATGTETNSSLYLNTSIGADTATGRPNPGSPLIAAGVNLFSVCNGHANPGLGALCSDFLGVPRPSSLSWDIGAYQSTTTQVLPPQALTATVQ